MDLKGYTAYTCENMDLNGIPNFFSLSLITKVTNFLKIPIFIGYPFLFFYFIN